MPESRHSVAVTLSRISGKLHLAYGTEYGGEIVYGLKFQEKHKTAATNHHQVHRQKMPCLVCRENSPVTVSGSEVNSDTV